MTLRPLLIDETSSTTGSASRPTTWDLTRVYSISGSDHRVAPRVRVVLHQDRTYPRQSSYTAGLWTATGWTEIHSLYGADPKIEGMPPCDLTDLLLAVALRIAVVPA